MENAGFGGGSYLESGGCDVLIEWNKLLLLNKVDLRFQALLGKTVCFKRSTFILSDL